MVHEQGPPRPVEGSSAADTPGLRPPLSLQLSWVMNHLSPTGFICHKRINGIKAINPFMAGFYITVVQCSKPRKQSLFSTNN